MRYVPVADLFPGTRIGRSIYGKDGQVWLGKGVVLTERFINRLKELEIPSIYVDDGLLADSHVRDVVSGENKQIIIQALKPFFQETAASGVKVISLPPQVRLMVNVIVQEVQVHPGLTYELIDIRMENEYLYYHSVNVSILAVMAGITMGWEDEQLQELCLGALLHDIGKLWTPQKILTKAGPLSKDEFEEVKKHTTNGWKALQKLPGIRNVALLHHERLDGQGYPRRVTDIPLTAQLAGIADIYDAMTSDRVFRRAYQPHEAYEILAGAGGFWFNLKLLQAFLTNISAFPIGSIVSLSSGAIAVVIQNQPGLSLYPRVRLLVPSTGTKQDLPNEFWCHEVGVGVLRVLNNKEIKALQLPTST